MDNNIEMAVIQQQSIDCNIAIYVVEMKTGQEML